MCNKTNLLMFCNFSFRTIASTRSEFSNNAYVFTERSMQLGEKIVLQILQTRLGSTKHFVYGTTSCNPATLNPEVLPENPEDLMDRPEYWIVKYDTNCYERGDIIVYSMNTEGKIFSVIHNSDNVFLLLLLCRHELKNSCDFHFIE